MTALAALSGGWLAGPALAQVEVGNASRLRGLVPAEDLENAAQQQYSQVIAEAKAKGTLAPPNDPLLKRVRTIAQRLVAQANTWNERAPKWQWEVNVIRSDDINAWCMPGGKMAVYTGLMDKLALTDDELAEFQRLNTAYLARFGFPFIICARLNAKSAILAAMQTRLPNTDETEFTTALGEIEKIAQLRLDDLLAK